jgi:hypothetical protein
MEMRKRGFDLVVVGEREDGQVLRSGVGGLHLELADQGGEVNALQEPEVVILIVVFGNFVLLTK